MRRLLALLLCLLPLAAFAEEARPYHIVMLMYRGCEESCRGFQDYFRRHRVPARFTVRDAAQDKSRIPAMVAEAKRLQPDLIVTFGTNVSLATAGARDAVDPAKNVTDIPVVFMAVSHPVEDGLVPTLAGSGRNVAGTLYLLPMAEQLRAARAYMDFRKLGFLYNPAEPNSRTSLEALSAQAAAFGFTVVQETLPLDAAGRTMVEALPAKVEALAAAGVDLLYLSADSVLNANRDAVTGEALRLGLPVFAAAEQPVAQSDALFGVVNRYDQVGRYTARLALRILRDGAKPGDLPVAMPRHFSYLINLRVAKRLGRYPPLQLLDVAEIVGGELR